MRQFLPAAALLLIAAGDPSTLDITHPWARATAGASRTGAAYVTIADKGEPDSLVSVSTAVAETAAVHETIDDHGTMRMRPAGKLAVSPGKPLSMAPGGYHIMLTGLKAPLKAGDKFPLTLTFEHAGPTTVTVTVEAIGGGGMAPMGH